jgi:hypothetical protein
MTPLEIPSMPSSDALGSEQKAEVNADISVGDFRQCPCQFWSKLHAKFHTKPARQASCQPEPVTEKSLVPKKTVPPLTLRQLGSGQDDELSESWKRFERRKLKRKERSRSKNSKNRSHHLDLPALSFKVLRFCGRMTSQLAQPSDWFSYRSPPLFEQSRFITRDESSAHRKWM